jgi:predicted CXXCH cytochrome family protein
MNAPSPQPRRRWLLASLAVIAGGVTVALAVTMGRAFFHADPARTEAKTHVPPRDPRQPPIALASSKRLHVWWDNVPAGVRDRSLPPAKDSNIHPADYVGPESCRACHQRNYDTWSSHPHRWMNALASDQSVRGDFSGNATINYRGGTATFERSGGDYRMHLERGSVRRSYRVTQTIGSRFFQYYVGKQIAGPEPASHPFFQKDHLLPFGYWLEPKEWVPTVHIGPERPDDDRPDPFEPPTKGDYFAEYAVSCNYCHTTFPLADLFGRRPHQTGDHAPRSLHWSVRPYLDEARPAEVPAMLKQFTATVKQNPMVSWDAEHYAAAFGVTCEACHLGAREHVASKGQILPQFFPRSPHLLVEGMEPPQTGRTHDNVNWACGRCHTGGRPTFAAGMSTWNSVEYSDAMRGSCYSQLTCINCHNPHRPIGPTWTATADHDDSVCLKCHDRLRPEAERRAHTHHMTGSEGARCLNCHMPRINEGLQDIVRTHMIYSPTRSDMIEANHPNACNLCHTDRPIDWTLGYLKEWYGRTYNETRIAANYPQRSQPVGIGWLASGDPAVRLVSADALTRRQDRSALPQLVEALDDPYLVNRQFAARGLERMLNMRLTDFGYRFFMTQAERRGPLDALRRNGPR